MAALRFDHPRSAAPRARCADIEGRDVFNLSTLAR
jgi:hypothetical protein